MNYESLESLINDKKRIKFKLYSLEYIIEKNNNEFVIYAEIYSKQKKMYKTLDEMFNSFTIYNEPLIDNLHLIHLID